MEKVRLAIVGCGTISQLNVPGYLMHDKCEVAVLCDPIKERAERRAKEWGISPKIYTSYDDVLNDSDVDAVELLTPTHLHPQQIIAGLEASKHVSCQKPISVTISETDEIIKAVERANTRFRITENFVYYPPIVKAKELMDAGVIGEPSMLRIRTIRGKYGDDNTYRIEEGALDWRRRPELNTGGALYDDGWHKYATAMFWLGDVEHVYSIVTKTNDFLAETPSAAMWKFKGRNCLGILDYASAPQMPIRTKYYPSDEFFEIIGEKGAIWVTRCTGELLDMPPVMVVKGHETQSYQVPMDWIESFNGAAADFIDSIVEGRQPNLDIHFSKKTLQLAVAVYEASNAERPMRPDDMS